MCDKAFPSTLETKFRQVIEVPQKMFFFLLSVIFYKPKFDGVGLIWFIFMRCMDIFHSIRLTNNQNRSIKKDPIEILRTVGL